MKKVFDINSDKINEIIIDKNRYYLKINSSDSIEDIAETFRKIVGNNFNNQVETGTEANTYNHNFKNYHPNTDCGFKSTGVKLKNHKYGWWAIRFLNVYKTNSQAYRWGATYVSDVRYNNALLIDHDRQEFRFIIPANTILEFPISKYIKYIKDSFKASDERKKDANIKKFVSSLTWMGIFGEFREFGWEDIGLTKSHDEFSYRAQMKNGRLLEIKLQKNSEEDNPLFTIWMVKGQLGKDITKEAMMKLVDSLLTMGQLTGKRIVNE